MQVKSALVICTRRIGDVLLATPVVKALTAAYPGVTVDMLVFSGTEAVIVPWSALRKIWTIPHRPGKREHWRLLRSLWRRYDLAVSVLTGDRPTWYAWVAGRYRLGTLTDDKKSSWKRRLLHHWVPFDDRETHTVAMNLRVLQPLDLPVQPIAPAVTWRAEDEALVRQTFPALADDSPFAVLHVTPKFAYKAWTVTGWGELARWLQQRDIAVIITAGPTPEDRALAEQILAQAPTTTRLAPAWTLSTLAYALSQVRIYVGTDTGVSHMAAALGTPSVVLFGPSNPVKWGPWPSHYRLNGNSPWQRVGSQRQGNVYLLQGSGNCVPCFNEGCDKHIASLSACLQELPAQRVFEAVDIMLRRDID